MNSFMMSFGNAFYTLFKLIGYILLAILIYIYMTIMFVVCGLIALWDWIRGCK